MDEVNNVISLGDRVRNDVYDSLQRLIRQTSYIYKEKSNYKKSLILRNYKELYIALYLKLISLDKFMQLEKDKLYSDEISIIIYYGDNINKLDLNACLKLTSICSVIVRAMGITNIIYNKKDDFAI